MMWLLVTKPRSSARPTGSLRYRTTPFTMPPMYHLFSLRQKKERVPQNQTLTHSFLLALLGSSLFHSYDLFLSFLLIDKASRNLSRSYRHHFLHKENMSFGIRQSWLFFSVTTHCWCWHVGSGNRGQVWGVEANSGLYLRDQADAPEKDRSMYRYLWKSSLKMVRI